MECSLGSFGAKGRTVLVAWLRELRRTLEIIARTLREVVHPESRLSRRHEIIFGDMKCSFWRHEIIFGDMKKFWRHEMHFADMK